MYDAYGPQTCESIREHLASTLDIDPDEVDLEGHVDEHDPVEFDILDETAMVQRIIDERLAPAARGEDFWDGDDDFWD